MLRLLSIAFVCALGAGCTSQNGATPAVTTQVGQVATAALASYQAALGAAEQAEAANPAVRTEIRTVTATAAPYIADAQTAASQASTAPTLASLAAELLADAAPYILVAPSAR